MWIAFNLITFVDITQQMDSPADKLYSCELLSIWLLLWISHSLEKLAYLRGFVVNCFQFDYFCGYHTAKKPHWQRPSPLWIAFNLITFVDITQQMSKIIIKAKGCELLSIWLLLWISHSPFLREPDCPDVVNCFQFDYFCGYHTAIKNNSRWAK